MIAETLVAKTLVAKPVIAIPEVLVAVSETLIDLPITLMAISVVGIGMHGWQVSKARRVQVRPGIIVTVIVSGRSIVDTSTVAVSAESSQVTRGLSGRLAAIAVFRARYQRAFETLGSKFTGALEAEQAGTDGEYNCANRADHEFPFKHPVWRVVQIGYRHGKPCSPVKPCSGQKMPQFNERSCELGSLSRESWL